MSRWSPQNVGSDQRPAHGFLATLGKIVGIAAPIVGAVVNPGGTAAKVAAGAGAGAAALDASRQQTDQQIAQFGQPKPNAPPQFGPGSAAEAALTPIQGVGLRSNYQGMQSQLGVPASTNALGWKSQWGGNPGARYQGLATTPPDYLKPDGQP